MRDAIRNFLEREDIDIIHFDTICVAHYLHSIKNSIPAVFSLNDCMALCYIEEARLFPVRNIIKKTKCFVQWLEVYSYEKNLCTKFQKCHVVSEIDKIYLEKMNKLIDVEIIPNGVDSEFYKPLNLPQDFPSLVFEGVMSAGAADYAIWFIRYVFKNVLKVVPQTRLYLVGKNPDRKLLNIAAQNKNVIVTGFVDDVRPYIDRATISVCPVLRASGILNKVLQAMAMEKAVVGTSCSFTGIKGAINGNNMVAAENPTQFAEEIINLIHNEEKRKIIGKNARTLVKNSYSWEKTAENFESLYEKAIEKFRLGFSTCADTTMKKKIFQIISKESCKI
jgi:glycosyltransferase involved in cell wall biosynthesis